MAIKFWHPRGETHKAFASVCGNARQIGGAKTNRPETADYLVTTSGLNANIEREAARLGALTVVLPEGGMWLSGRLSAASETGRDVTVIWRVAQR